MPRREASSGGALTITLIAMTLSASMILVDQTAVPLATPHVVEDLGGQIDQGPWVLTANILPLAAFMGADVKAAGVRIINPTL